MKKVFTLLEAIELEKEEGVDPGVIQLDKDLANGFNLTSVKGTLEQLNFIIQALRVSAVYAATADGDDLDNITFDDKLVEDIYYKA